MIESFSLAGRAALVTGSSRGIGASIGRGLAAANAEVVFHGNTTPPGALPSGAVFLTADLQEADAPRRLIAEAFRAKPALDLLVANAGGFFDTPFFQMGAVEWERTINLNVRAAYFLVQAFARELAARDRAGAVVVVSSTNGIHPEEDGTAYDISKGALITMTRTLALALAPHRIRVNGIAPGLIRTPLTAPWMEAHPEKRRHYENKILMHRVGDADECAGAAVFLLSSAASYITGQLLVIDGGLTVGQIAPM